jgi:hypothetical protein
VGNYARHSVRAGIAADVQARVAVAAAFDLSQVA